MVSSCLFIEFLSICKSGSLHLYLFLMPFRGFFFFCLFISSYSRLFGSVLSYYILFYYHPLDAYLLSSERKKGVGSDGRGGGREDWEE